MYSSVNPPSWGVNSQDPRALSPLAVLLDFGVCLSTQSWPSPPFGAAFRAYCSDRGPGSGHPGASIFRYWPGIPPPLSYSTSLSGFPHFGSSRSHLCRHKLSGSTGRSRSLAQPTQAHLLSWNDLVPSSPVSSHSRTNQASSGGAVYSVCRRLQKATSDLPVASREKWCGPTGQGYRPSSRHPSPSQGARHRGALRPSARC